MIGWIIVGCEVGFWVLLVVGLAGRYILRWRRVGAVLLICVPLVDLVLLVAAVIDLRRGASGSVLHALAAVYIGFSVAFGHQTISRLDALAAHRWAGGPAPSHAPRHGGLGVHHTWRQWGRTLLAGSLATALLGAAVLIVGDPGRTAPLVETVGWIVVVVLVSLFVGPVRRQYLQNKSSRLAERHERTRSKSARSTARRPGDEHDRDAVRPL
ncbi:hypothetical protein [Amycolatopsis sp. NPDC004625]|uniref:hypothetical protein n=1 Tax=Amycolatopsis sp. NPDC004625 TaxID=3154670 RepID=UPI0033BCDB54